MLQPKKTKHKKVQKGRNRGLATTGNKVSFGEFGLKAAQRGRITARQIEAARRAMTHHIKRGGKIWIRLFPDKPITKKPLEVRQGKGKGNVEYWSLWCSREKCCMRWKELKKASPVRRSSWRRPSCRSRPLSRAEVSCDERIEGIGIAR